MTMAWASWRGDSGRAKSKKVSAKASSAIIDVWRTWRPNISYTTRAPENFIDGSQVNIPAAHKNTLLEQKGHNNLDIDVKAW